jgi:hypothetical protein
MAVDTLTTEEGKQLLALCHSGKLYEIEAWIAAGRSLHVPAGLRKSPLQVAIDLGFHSLVVLLAKHEDSQAIKNGALSDAVELRRLELAELLLSLGADARGIPFSAVLLAWNPAVIRLFLRKGADVVTGSPFAAAFGDKVRTALRPFIEYKAGHPELAEEMQLRVDTALRYFCGEGDLKWASLLVWAGGNPRVLGPKLYEREDADSFTTGLQEACYGGHTELLRKFKPDSERDDLTDLFKCAAIGSHKDTMQFLLDRGANPNDKPNAGSSALDMCRWHMNIDASHGWDSTGLVSRFELWRSLDRVSFLAERGALWRPDDRTQVNGLRRTLLKCEPEVTIDLLKTLIAHEACSRDALRELLHCRPMAEHLSKQGWWLSRLKLLDIATYPGARNAGARGQLSVPRSLMARYQREVLYDKAWSTPMRLLAKEYGISDVGLAKVCKKLHIPLPGRGYWARKAAEKAVAKKPGLEPVTIT